jgi:hypothetical protein
MDRIMEIFSRLCLAQVRPDPQAMGLVTPPGWPEGGKWVDAKSKTFLTHDTDRRTVTAYHANNLSRPEIGRISKQTEQIIQRDFPQLALDISASKEDENIERFRMICGFRTQNRWGIYIYSFLPGSSDGSTFITYASRKSFISS